MVRHPSTIAVPHSRYLTSSPAVVGCVTGALMAVFLWLGACEEGAQIESAREILALASKHDAKLEPLVAPSGLNWAAVRLGDRLFHDPILSRDGTVSCASCHDLKHGGDDGLVVSVGIDNRLGELNAPTVLNASLNSSQFWDGRAPTLSAQIDGPIHNPNEMDSDWGQIVERLNADASYRVAFETAYGAPLDAKLVRQAIVAFEESLITIDAPIDRWLLGDRKAMPIKALEGLHLFEQHGCISCHQGRAFGGNLFQRLGVMREYFEAAQTIRRIDLGRFNHTQDSHDKHVFRVPSLRNAELTGPYFHDGSAATLPDGVRVMLRFQVGVEPDEAEVDRLVEFLRSLTGVLKGRSA